MNREEIIKKIMEKKEFSQLPKRDVEKVYSCFERRQTSDEEKIRLARETLHKVFGAFGSRKLFSSRNKSPEWFLKKHLSTRERFNFYRGLYKRLLNDFDKKEILIIDLGAGINGLSYGVFPAEFKIDYIGIEAVGQLVDLTNNYFKKEKIKGRVFHLSLFELDKIKELIKKEKEEKMVFLFKVVDSLEMMEKNYSKKLISEVCSLVSRVVVSFSTESMTKRRKFKVKRYWLLNFINENFRILDDFEIKGERFIILCNKKQSK